MKQHSTLPYLILHYIKDLFLVMQLFMFPFFYYFFKSSYAYDHGLSFFSSVGFLILVLLFSLFVSLLIVLSHIENKHKQIKKLQIIKNNRYSSTILAGCILGFSIINLIIFVTFTVISLIFAQSSLAMYSTYSYLIIIHIEIFVLTLYMLLRLNSIGHKRSLPLIDLFKYESISEHKVIKKPLY